MQIFNIVRRDDNGGYVRVEHPFDAKKQRRDLLKGIAFPRSIDLALWDWRSLFGEEWEKAMFKCQDDALDFLDHDRYRKMVGKDAVTDPALAVYLALFNERPITAFPLGVDFQELWDAALQIMKEDAFFGPITATYGDDFGVSYIVREEGHTDNDSDNLLFKMKLTALDSHLQSLIESDCYVEGSEHHDPEMWEAYENSRELDKDADAFVARFVRHFAKDDSAVHQMFAALAAARGPSGINAHNLMQWVLRWSETTRREIDRWSASIAA